MHFGSICVVFFILFNWYVIEMMVRHGLKRHMALTNGHLVPEPLNTLVVFNTDPDKWPCLVPSSLVCWKYRMRESENV